MACISCGGSRLAPVLSLGKTPLANALLTAEQLARPEPRFALELVFCPDCSLVQITERVPPEQLFGEYAYFSSFSDTTVAAAKALAERLARERALGPGSLAMELASNDGYLLRHYRDAGVPVLGIEPAANIARVANERGIRTRCEFFGRELAETLAREGCRADVLHANNVLAHVPDLNGFVSGIERALKPSGVAVIEVPYVRDLIEKCEFDTIYHEHLCYFSVSALDALFARHGLGLAGIERIPAHGGSLRLFAAPGAPRGAATKVLLDEERSLGMLELAYYAGFGQRVEKLRRDLVALLARLRGEGKRIAAYGASAKGSTLLNYFGIDARHLEYVVDRSTEKQGRYTPGTHLPILPPERLREDRPDYLLLLAWNFLDEIAAQQAEYRGRGGRFIVPVPEVRVI
ncbi:MAG: methyltransferase [Betaproteobacteria bacterium RIFCSPHIGHO2_12_FULL_69_13]|nr:MAG: methyltransferase [Betaproteobacteria bacterium RIFCSPHIGHO2_12_FULL_69_13]OGA65751.1 MAG: methyltransferase [Betaproteobacteria bacterium RIFCSPLOWO2_12_FULL_68_20]